MTFGPGQMGAGRPPLEGHASAALAAVRGRMSTGRPQFPPPRQLSAEEEAQVADNGSDSGNGDSPAPQKDTVVLGMHLNRLDAAARKQFQVPDDMKGAVITDVDQDSPAGDAELRPGDVVRQVGHADTLTPRAVNAAVSDAKKSGRPSVLLLVNRGGSDMFVALKFPPA